MAAHAYLTVFTGTTQGVYKVDVGLGTVTRIANLAAPRGLCVTPDELYAYVAGVSSAVQKIDTTTGATLVTIATPLPAFELDISFDGAYVYALCPGGPLYVIATATDTIVATISAAALSAVPDCFYPTTAPDGNHVYVVGALPSGGSFNVAIIDVGTWAVSGGIALPATTNPGFLSNMGVSADSTLGYVVQPNASNTGPICTVLDLVANTVVTTIALTPATAPNTGYYTTCNYENSAVYCSLSSSTSGDGRVSLVDPISNTETLSVPGFQNTQSTALNPTEEFLLAANATGTFAVRLDTASFGVGYIGSLTGQSQTVAFPKGRGGQHVVMLT